MVDLKTLVFRSVQILEGYQEGTRSLFVTLEDVYWRFRVVLHKGRWRWRCDVEKEHR